MLWNCRGFRPFFVALFAAVVVCCFGAPSTAAPVATRAVVFVSPPGEELENSLRDALTAQLSGTGAEVVFEHFSAASVSLRAAVSEARSMVSAHEAVGVFWLDVQSDRDWLVYLAEPEGDRVLVRRISVDPDGVAAGVESVAVITRQSTEALLAGETIGMQPVAVAPEEHEPPPSLPATTAPELRRPLAVPPRPAERTRGVFLAIAYHGDSFAPQIGWQSGLRLGAGYRASNGLYGGVGYVLDEAPTVASTGLAFQASRTPIDADVGFAFGHRRWFPSIELRTLVDVLRRHDVTATPPFAGTGDATRAVVFLSPRVQLGYTVSSVLELYLGVAVDVALNGFSFVSQADGQETPLLVPHRVRPALELGAVFWP